MSTPTDTVFANALGDTFSTINGRPNHLEQKLADSDAWASRRLEAQVHRFDALAAQLERMTAKLEAFSTVPPSPLHPSRQAPRSSRDPRAPCPPHLPPTAKIASSSPSSTTASPGP